MKRLLLLIFIFLNYYSWGQGNMISISSTVPANMTVCGAAKLFTVSIYNPSPFLITNDTLLITVPTGIQYVSGSLTGGTFLNSFGGIIKVVLPNISALTNLNVTFMASAQCTVVAFIAGGGITKNNIRVNYTANNNHTYNTHNTSLYLVKQPFLTITTVTNQSYTGNIGDVFTRCITVVNAGSGELTDFTFTDIHGPGIQITASNKGVLTNIGMTAKIILNGTDFLGIGDGDNLFESGESITICETVTVLNCISASSAFKAFWGCSVNACQSSVSSGNVLFPNYLPVLLVTPIASMNSCIGPGNASPQQLKIINKGTGNAINVQLEIFQATGGGYNGNVGSNIDPASFTIQTGIGGAPASITPNSTVATNALSCMTSPKGKVLFTLPLINAGDTIYLNWNSYSCCSNACTNTGQSYINGWRYKGSYQNICTNTYVIAEAWGRVYSQIYGALVNDGSPSTLTNGQTGTFNFLFSNYTNSYPAGPGAHWKFEFTLPPFACLSYSNIRILHFNGVSTWTPNTVTTSGSTVTAIFNSPPPFGLNQAELKINLTLNCSLCTGIDSLSAVTVKSFYIPNNTCACEIGVSCQNAPLSIICPDPCPAGVFFNNFDIKRTSYGLPDNEAGGGDGTPDGSGSLNFTKIKTNRSMFGDTITAGYTGIVNTNFAHPSLQYCYASSSISNGNLLSFLDAQLFIYRGGSLLYTCTSFTPVVTTTGTTRSFLYDLSAPTLISSGCLPGGYLNTDGDSLIFKPRYKVTVNPGNTILTCYATNKFYSSDIANPTLAADKYQCSNFNGNFIVIGYFYNSYGADSYYVNSCDNIPVSQNYYLSIGPGDDNYAGGNLFPYEYRNWAHVSTLTATVPPGYTYISARFNQLRTSGTLASNTSAWQTVIPVNPNADTLVFNVEPYFQGYGGTIPLSDDGFYGKLEVTIQPSCEVTPTISQGIQYDWTFEPSSYLTGPGSDTTFETGSDQIIYDPPVLFLQSVLPSIFALDSTTSWDVSISNTSNVSDALNTWLSGPTISGVAITKVVDLDSNVVIPLTDTIYQVGTVRGGDVRHFRITASFTSCGPDSVIVHSGWNCNAGYPSGVGTYPCTPQRIALTLTPLTPAFLINSTGPSASIQLCDTAQFSAECVNVQLGTAYNVILKATLPAGATLIPGSSQFSYPLSNPAINIPDPVFISGNEWKWDITATDTTIGANGLKGILDTILNSFRVTFKFITDCGYTSGSSVAYVVTGNAACGSATEPDISLSPSLDIIGAIEPYATIIVLSTTYVSPCAGNSSIRVVVHNQGPTAFGVTDSIAVQLPIGVPFITGSFSGIYNAPLNGTPRQYTLNGKTYLVWKLPIGTAAGDSSIFSFEYIGDPPALACGIILFEAQTYSISTITCVATGNNCITQIITGDTALPVFTYKAYLSLSNGYATSVPNPPGGETVTISYDITNTGQAILTDADSIVQFYFDANADGIYSTGDVFIAEDTLLIPKDSMMRFSSTFNAPAGQACSIIAIIDPAVNSCVCDFSQLLIPSSLHSLGSDSTLCSGETITLSSAPVTGYTYSWTPVTGLSDPNIANTVLTTSNLTTAPVSTSYILTTNRMGCTSADTVVITVNPLPIGTITGTIDVCENSGAPNITFVGSGSTGPYTFTYTINGGLNQTVTSTNGDTAIVLAPTNVPGTFVYNLVSIQDSSATACAQPQSASITITVNPLPLASALIGGTAEVCEGGVSPNITFTGSVGTAPFTFTYTINNGSLLTATTISGNSIVVSAPTSTPGIFIYNLLSVQDASSTTCSQPQSGSATITVNPLPTATIGGTIAVCRDATAPDITFIGSNGTAPYTFTYTLNGGANQTVISTNGDTAIVQASTVIDGTFVYTLVSVIDASTTTCSQVQNGTATIIVDPLPTATISGTTSLCQYFPEPLITFIGYGGVPPYIFTFTINGVAQPTVVTTSVDSVTISAPTTVAGIFTYALVSVQDANLAACTHPQTGDAIITVHPKPVAAFSSTKVCNGNATQFNDSSTTSSGTISTWVWDMGDGSALNSAQSPFYIYPAAGMHSVNLFVTNNFGCADTVIKTVQVYYNPIADFTHNDVCFGDTMHFSNTSTVDFSTSITSNLWVFGDGGVTSNLVNPVHYYSVPGTFNVTLVTTTGNGCSAVANIPVKTFDPPVTGFTFNNTCLLDSVLFTNTSLNPAMGTIASWSWNFGDNSPLNTSTWSPRHLYSIPGDYIVILTTYSSNLGCPDTLQDTITVFPMPVADFGSANVCLNQVMYFYDSSTVASGSISAWEWDFGDGTPSDNNQNPSHTFTNDTTYSVSLIATSVDGCKDTIVKNVVIHPLPSVEYSTANVCDGNVVSFTDLSSIPVTDTILSYSWNFGDNSPLNTNQNTSHLYASAGSYNVQLTVVSYFGCVDSISKISIVNPNPVVDFAVNDSAGCEPFCITFQDSSSIITGSNIGWLWDFGNGTQANNSESPVCCYSNDSVFAPVFYSPVLTVTSDSGCVSSISKINFITAYPKPDANFTVEPKTETIINPVISFTDLSAGSNFWSWNFGDTDTSSLSDPLPHTYADTGTYTITLITNTNYGCLDTSYQNISIEPDFVFYIPNSFTPNDDGINETFSGKGIFIIKYEMSIFDRWGNLVFFSDNINTPWDGKANHGKELAQRDVYIYSIRVTDIKTIEHDYKGKVTLIR